MNWKEAVEEYTGESVRDIEVIEDPKVNNVYAIQAILEGEGVIIQFLYNKNEVPDTQGINPDSLEEVEFESWPPKSGKLKWEWHIWL